MNVIQVGVIGSMMDTAVASDIKSVAIELGTQLAAKGITLLFGYEGDFESLSFLAAQGARAKGGRVVAFMRDDVGEMDRLTDMTLIRTGQQRGGGREFPFILSCDVIVAMQGGSGTMMEIAMAYQAGIPVIALRNSGGWSEKLADDFLDERKRAKIVGVDTPEEAVQEIIAAISHKGPRRSASPS